ncbi:MAG: AEC family transporter, partial [Halobaculum sp.]
LAVAPAIAVAVASVVGFRDPTAARVFVLESAMPAAVTPVVLVGEFAEDATIRGIPLPAYVSTAVLVTTALSLVTATLTISLLRSGLVG